MRSQDMHGSLPAGNASSERNAETSFRPAAVTGPMSLCGGAECGCLARFRRAWLSRVAASGLALTETGDADWLAARGAASLPNLADFATACGGRCRCWPPDSFTSGGAP